MKNAQHMTRTSDLLYNKTLTSPTGPHIQLFISRNFILFNYY